MKQQDAVALNFTLKTVRNFRLQQSMDTHLYACINQIQIYFSRRPLNQYCTMQGSFSITRPIYACTRVAAHAQCWYAKGKWTEWAATTNKLTLLNRIAPCMHIYCYWPPSMVRKGSEKENQEEEGVDSKQIKSKQILGNREKGLAERRWYTAAAEEW